MTDLITELEMRVAAKRKELEEEENALATVRRMMGQAPLSNNQPIVDKGQIDFSNLIGNSEKKRTLVDEVRDVVLKFGTYEFTVAHIEAALKKLEIPVDAKNPRARIGIAVSNILEEGLIVRTFEGGGNVPHRYKLKSAVDAESLV
jgi:hypothetical protein